MKWARDVARMKRDEKFTQKILVGKSEGKTHLGDLGVDGKAMLKWILMKYGGIVWSQYIRLGIRNMEGCSNHGDESLGSKKMRGVDYQLLFHGDGKLSDKRHSQHEIQTKKAQNGCK
jgi:hypothetical protein